jgi:hypothetical protein
MAVKLRSDDGAYASLLWRRRGKPAFDAEVLPDVGPTAVGAPLRAN